MTETVVVTPTGIPSSASPDPGRRVTSGAPVHEFIRYQLHLPAPAPANLRVSLRLGKEDDGVWAHIGELDVSAEGANISEAFLNVLAAAREWLAYIRDDEPDLAEDLAAQVQYVRLLEAPPFSWFKTIELAE
jgi:hypothetical protein